MAPGFCVGQGLVPVRLTEHSPDGLCWDCVLGRAHIICAASWDAAQSMILGPYVWLTGVQSLWDPCSEVGCITRVWLWGFAPCWVEFRMSGTQGLAWMHPWTMALELCSWMSVHNLWTIWLTGAHLWSIVQSLASSWTEIRISVLYRASWNVHTNYSARALCCDFWSLKSPGPLH